jgi:thiol-disulfide isomerase/thioredoxin
MKFIKVLFLLLVFTSISYAKGLKAPDFELKDENGNIVKLSDLKNNVVVLIFWATTCGVCEKELPEISFLQEKYKDKPVKFYAIVINSDNINEIKQVKSSWGFDIPVLIGNYDTVKNYRIIGTPIIYILRKDLTIGKIFFGATSINMLEKYINKFLGE